MYVARLRFYLLVALFAGVAAVGCGKENFQSPTSPSSPGIGLSSALPSNGEASVDVIAVTADVAESLKRGEGKGGDKEAEHGDKEKHKDNESADDDNDDDEDGAAGPGEHGHRGELSGFVTAKGADSLTVRGVAVKVTTTTVIRNGHTSLTLSDIEVGDHVQARGTRDAAGTTLTATEIKVEHTGGDNDDEELD